MADSRSEPQRILEDLETPASKEAIKTSRVWDFSGGPGVWSHMRHSQEVNTKTYTHGLLMAQWSRIHLPMQETGLIPDLRRSTCLGVVKPVGHIYWACVLESRSHNYWARVLESRTGNCWVYALESRSHDYCAHVLQLLKPVRPGACACSDRSPCF